MSPDPASQPSSTALEPTGQGYGCKPKGELFEKPGSKTHTRDFRDGSVVKNLLCDAGDMGLIPSPGTKIHTHMPQRANSTGCNY